MREILESVALLWECIVTAERWLWPIYGLQLLDAVVSWWMGWQ